MIRVLLVLIIFLMSPMATLAQTSRRPPAIHTDGVPEIPAGVWEGLHRYQEIRSASFEDWHPSGGMVIASRIDEVTQLYLVAAPGAAPVRLTSGREPVTNARALPAGSLLFSRGAGGDENFQIYRLRAGPSGLPAAGAEDLLTDGQSRNLLGPPDRAGKRLPFTSTRRNGRDADLCLLDLAAGKDPQTLLRVEEESWSLEDWSEAGDRALILRYVSASESYPYILELATGRKTALPAELPEVAAGAKTVRRDALRFGPGSRSVYLVSDARGEFRELARLDLETGRYQWITSGTPWDVEDVQVSGDGRLLAYTVNVDGWSRLYLAGLESGEDRDVLRAGLKEVDVGRAVLSGLRFSRDARFLGFTLARASVPAEAHSCEVASGKVTRWTTSERAGFAESDFIAPEIVRFASFDGRLAPAFLYRPAPEGTGASPRRAPVIIQIHGGPESQFRPGFSPLRQYFLRELGAAILAPNVRGSTGYGRTYALLDNGRLREDSVKDIGAALDFIAKDPGLDPTRVAVMGGSYGGYMVLASLLRYGSRIRAGIDAVGISNFVTFLENTSAYRRQLRRVEYGDERDPGMRRFLEEISPSRGIGNLRSALLVIHGTNDPRVPLSETKNIVARARAAAGHVWAVYADNEGHGFKRRENTDFEEAAVTHFLRAHLVGDVPPADGRALHGRGVELFREQRFRDAVLEFDRAIAAGGAHTAEACWERGLALYYAGDFAGARAQFEGYHRVDPLDIENGLWRYLSIAAVEGVEKAREGLFRYPDRRRKPFPALHDLYAGKGNIEAVLGEAADGGGAPGPERGENLFYARLYIAKYLEAAGRRQEARTHLDEALGHRVDHLMYRCAEIEAERARR
jgi:dipeptidyl aminopeptidase/acylaminoacyl peptidase